MATRATNSIAPSTQKKVQFSNFIKSDAVAKSIATTLGSETKSKKFTASLISAVSTNPALRDCDSTTIVSSALLGESLNLSPSPQLGHYYLVPFNDRKNGRTVATFQLGYKGMIQLAIRSGQYKRLNVVAVKEGELISYNPFEEEIKVVPIEDEKEREQAKTIGYYAMFELVNGFRKSMYWSREKMEHHAETYSKGYSAHKGYTFWERDFDGMAYKTMLRQIISKWGVMSIEMQQAYVNDMSVQDKDGNPEYVDGADAEFFDITPVEQPVVQEQPAQEAEVVQEQPSLL